MEIKKFQMGGAAPVAEAAPAPQDATANDPVMQIAQLFMQGLQTGDCNLLAQGAEAFLMLLQQASAPQQPPVGGPQGQPVFKRGGKMKRNKKGCK